LAQEALARTRGSSTSLEIIAFPIVAAIVIRDAPDSRAPPRYNNGFIHVAADFSSREAPRSENRRSAFRALLSRLCVKTSSVQLIRTRTSDEAGEVDRITSVISVASSYVQSRGDVGRPRSGREIRNPRRRDRRDATRARTGRTNIHGYLSTIYYIIYSFSLALGDDPLTQYANVCAIDSIVCK